MREVKGQGEGGQVVGEAPIMGGWVGLVSADVGAAVEDISNAVAALDDMAHADAAADITNVVAAADDFGNAVATPTRTIHDEESLGVHSLAGPAVGLVEGGRGGVAQLFCGSWYIYEYTQTHARTHICVFIYVYPYT